MKSVFIRTAGVEIGPFDRTKFAELISCGEIHPDTKVRSSDSSEWVLAKLALPELFETNVSLEKEHLRHSGGNGATIDSANEQALAGWIGSTLKVAGPISAIGGFVSDVLQPIAPFGLALVGLSSITAATCGFRWFRVVKPRLNSRKATAAEFRENSTLGLFRFSVVSTVILGLVTLFTNSKPESGFLADKFDGIASLQASILGLKEGVARVETKVSNVESLIQRLPDVIERRNEKATSLLREGKLAEAEKEYLAILELQKDVAGSDDEVTLFALNNLGIVQKRKKDYNAAAATFRKALDETLTTIERTNPLILAVMHNLGNVLAATGEYKEAEALLIKAYEGKVNALGYNDDDTLMSAISLAEVFIKEREFLKAEQHLTLVFNKSKSSLSATNPHKLEIAGLLAMTHKRQGDIPAALLVLHGSFSDTIPETHVLRYNLACYECLGGNLEKAKELIRDEVSKNPKSKPLALQDDDLTAIRSYINTLD